VILPISAGTLPVSGTQGPTTACVRRRVSEQAAKRIRWRGPILIHNGATLGIGFRLRSLLGPSSSFEALQGQNSMILRLEAAVKNDGRWVTAVAHDHAEAVAHDRNVGVTVGARRALDIGPAAYGPLSTLPWMLPHGAASDRQSLWSTAVVFSRRSAG
jgi:hypothetical protein